MRALRRTALGLVLTLAPASAAAQVTLETRAEVGRMEHRVRATSPVQPAAGAVFGGAFGVLFGDRFEVWGEALGGHLAADSPDRESREVAEVQLHAGATVRPWLTLQGGAHVRSYSTALARQRWSSVRLGAEARVPLALPGVRGILRGHWMPIVSVSGIQGPDVALLAGAGLEWGGRRFGVSALYSLERYDFPGGAGVQRLEEVSALRVRGVVRLRGAP